MRLDEYLKAKDETNARFARRAGISEALVSQIKRGAGTRVSTAQAIVEASKAEPTKDGQWIDYPDLVPFDDDQAA